MQFYQIQAEMIFRGIFQNKTNLIDYFAQHSREEQSKQKILEKTKLIPNVIETSK